MYVDISLVLLKGLKRKLPFDIFIQRSQKNYTKVFSKDDVIDWDRVDRYKEKGLKVFYCQEADYLTYMMIVEKMGKEISGAPKGWGSEEAVFFMKEMVNYTVEDIRRKHNVEARTLESAASFTQGCVEVLSKNPKNLVRLVNLLSQKPYLVKNAAMTSIFSLMLAKKAGLEGERTFYTLGMGSLFHDIGISQLSFDPEDHELLTGEQRQELMRHPELGKRLLDGMKGVGEDVGLIVLQHHEQPNGYGYPNRLRNPTIFYPAKIVSIADSFSSLITNRTFREAFSAHQAISKMREDQGKFDSQLLEHLSSIFA